MTNQERFDELDNFLNTLRLLKDELDSKDLLDEINYLLYNTDYEYEMDKLEDLLAREYDNELDIRNKEYRKIQGF